MSLAKNIQLHLKRKGLTLNSLSRLSGVKQPTLHGWTTGRSVKNITDLKKVCNVLEVGLHMILFDEKDPFEISSQTLLEQNLEGRIRIVIEKF